MALEEEVVVDDEGDEGCCAKSGASQRHWRHEEVFILTSESAISDW